MNAHTNVENLKPPVTRHLFSVEEFHKLAEIGLLGEDARVELIEGELINMAPIGNRHAFAVNRLTRLMTVSAAGRCYISVQNPIVLGSHSEPEPDLVLASLPEGKYAAAHPGSKDILLVIEVADTTIEYDRRVKIPLYAEHGIVEAWLFDLTQKQLEIYLEPSADGYRRILKPARDALVSPSFVDGVQINFAELFAE